MIHIMNILTRHFIHLYFLAEFEVFFYIYYIMPYEKSLIYGLFKINKWTREFPLQNVTQYIDYKCDGYDNEFDEYNGKLINNCLYFIYIINVVLFGIFIHDITAIYAETMKRRPYNSNSSLVSFGSSNNIADMKKSDEIVQEESFLVQYWKKSELLTETAKTFQFIVIVGVFEYVFFTTVVNKYKIVNSKMIICKMIDEL
jgi:hypothetical protein